LMRELPILNLTFLHPINYLEVPSEGHLFPLISTEKRSEHYSSNFSSATLITIFGGRVHDLQSILIEERIPEEWESRVRNRWGLTFGSFNLVVFPLEFSISEKKYSAKLASQPQSEESQEAANRAS
jgi:hypothetical protein